MGAPYWKILLILTMGKILENKKFMNKDDLFPPPSSKSKLIHDILRIMKPRRKQCKRQ